MNTPLKANLSDQYLPLFPEISSELTHGNQFSCHQRRIPVSLYKKDNPGIPIS